METSEKRSVVRISSVGLVGVAACGACCMPILLPVIARLGIFSAGILPLGWAVVVGSPFIIGVTAWIVHRRRRSARCTISRE